MFERRVSLVSITVVFWLAATAGRSDEVAPLAGFDEYVAQAMAEWQVPGLGLAIVRDDRVVHARGYGVRTLGKPEPVDQHTLFAIGSQTKAFTAATVAMLVDEGKLTWDDRAIDHLPEFRLYDPYVTRELSVRDLLCHRSGLERGDLLWYSTNFGREEVLHRVRHLAPTTSFRSAFQYQNIMFLAAGQLVPAKTGQSWDDFVAARIFAPLGMARSSTSVRALAAQDNVATPHERIDAQMVAVPWKNLDNIAPAGSINSSPADMAQWVRMQLRRGELDGKRLISETQIDEMRRPQMLLGNNRDLLRLFREGEFLSYGLGWFTYSYRGATVVEHGGSIDGMRAQVAMVPKLGLGMVLLANQGGGSMTEALRYRILDRYLGQPERDWSKEMLAAQRAAESEAAEAAKKREAARLAGTRPSRALGDYAGKYQSPMYGEVEVTERAGALELAFGNLPPVVLGHWQVDTFQAVDWPRAPERSLVVFRRDGDAVVVGVELEGLGEFARPKEPPR